MLLLLRFSTLIKFFPLFFNSLLNLSSNSSGLTCFLALQRYDQTDNQNNILLRVGFSPSSEYFNSLYCDIIRFSDVFFFLFLFLLVRVHSRCRIPFSFVLSLLFFRAKFEKMSYFSSEGHACLPLSSSSCVWLCNNTDQKMTCLVMNLN